MNSGIYSLATGFLVGLPAAFTGTHCSAAPPPRSHVRPLDRARLAEGFRSLSPRDQELVTLYLEGARRYVLTPADGVFPDRGPEHWRNLAERAHGAAVLATIASDWPEDLKARCRQQSVAFLQEFTSQFKTTNDFGNPWQCSWWVGEMGIAAWFLWDQLSPELQDDVARMVVFHADRIAAAKPGARVLADTEAETVAWNSTVLSLAANLMPTHPHNAQWQTAARRYAYTVFGTAADLQDPTPGDEGKPIKDWVVGANIHDDFSLENHNRFHIEYVFAAYRFLLQGAALYRLAGNPVPMAFSHHLAEVHDQVLCACLNGSKFAVFVSDNDWKRYHLWTESPAVHGFVALMTSSPLASALEAESLRQAASFWRAFPADFQYANPYVCGKPWTPRIADIVLLHLLSPASPPPLPAAEVEARLAGVHEKPDVRLVTQYSTEGSFRSFYWGPGPVVRQIEPRSPAWLLLPCASNYRPAVNGKLLPDRGATTTSAKGPDWFWVVRAYPHGEREAFISLPDEVVMVMNTLDRAALDGARAVDRFVTVEKPYQRLKIYYQQGEATYDYGQTSWTRSDDGAGNEVKTAWLNLADSIGFVTLCLPAQAPRMLLPAPGARSALSLHHAASPNGGLQLVTVVFPNQAHAQTRAQATAVAAASTSGLMTCRAANYFVWANFSGRAAALELPSDMQPLPAVKTSPNEVGILQQEPQTGRWRRLK